MSNGEASDGNQFEWPKGQSIENFFTYFLADFQESALQEAWYKNLKEQRPEIWTDVQDALKKAYVVEPLTFAPLRHAKVQSALYKAYEVARTYVNDETILFKQPGNVS